MSDCGSSPGEYPGDCQLLESMRTRIREKAETVVSDNQKRIFAKAREIKLLLLDVDGVLTNGNLLYSDNSVESKSFNTQDGFGLRLLREADIDTGIITARQSGIVQRRAEELNMTYIYQGAKKKNIAFKEILKQSGLKPYQVAYMGDDWLDLVLLQQVGLAATPANGVSQVKEAVHFVTEKEGGAGCVRELCDLIIEAQGKTNQLLQSYLNR